MPPSAPPRILRSRRAAPNGVATIQENGALPDSSRVRQKHNVGGIVKPILKKESSYGSSSGDGPREKKK
jgi:hypothetical protein